MLWSFAQAGVRMKISFGAAAKWLTLCKLRSKCLALTAWNLNALLEVLYSKGIFKKGSLAQTERRYDAVVKQTIFKTLIFDRTVHHTIFKHPCTLNLTHLKYAKLLPSVEVFWALQLWDLSALNDLKKCTKCQHTVDLSCLHWQLRALLNITIAS